MPMRLWFASICAAFALCGCQHYVELSQLDFDRGNVNRYRFERDNYLCGTKATVQQTRVGGGDPTGVYNDSYSACMEKLGYRANGVHTLGL